MIVVDKEACTGCGTCVKVCHEHCMTLVDRVVHIDYAVCSTCTQCIAVCPTRALSWDGAPASAYEPARLPTPAQLDELFKERRTVRQFRADKLDPALVDEIIGYGGYAPTHHYHLRAVATQDDAIIDEIDRVVMRVTTRLYRLLFRPRFMRHVVRIFAPSFEPEYARARPKLERGQEAGSAFPSRPAALVFVVGDRRTPLGELSAQYAMYNMNLYAQARGVGCQNLVGTQPILNGNRAVRDRLGLGRHERILAMCGLGYPAVKFRNRVEGKAMPIEWIGR